jgi:uncharacterized membrane protein
MPTSLQHLAFSLVLATTGSAHAFQPFGAPVDFNRPGFESTQPWDVNDAGTIVGNSDGVGFVWSNGVFSSVVHPSQLQTGLTGLTADGRTFVGDYWTVDDLGVVQPRSFLLTDGVFSDFDVPNATGTTIRRISDNGRYLVGTWSDAAGGLNGFAFDRLTAQRTDFLADPGRNQIAQGVTNGGLVVGSFIRTPPAGGPSVAGAFSFDLATGVRIEYLDAAGYTRPRFRDINEAGLIAGFAFGDGFVGDLSTWQTFPTTDPLVNVAAYGLNNSGTLVGYRFDTNTALIQGWVATAVPEPTGWMLWAAGLAGIAGLRRARPTA